MKLGPIIFAVVLVGGATYQFTQNKSSDPVEVRAVPEVPEPDLQEVRIRLRSSITNATIKKVYPDGILFLCEQGLVKARFSDLDAEFLAYYGGRATAAVKNSRQSLNSSRASRPQMHNATVTPRAQSRYTPVKQPPSKEDRAREALRRKKRLSFLKDRIEDQKRIRDKYLRQSVTQRQKLVSSEENEVAKFELEKFEREYRELKND